MNMQVLKRSRREPQVGDIFVYRVKDRPFGYGRVIRLGTKIGGFTNVILLYLYQAFSQEKLNIPRLSSRRLLLPPLGTNRRPWTMGYFETILNRPLRPQDVLPIHCFEDESRYRFCNEYGKKLPRRTEPCGLYVLDSFRTIDAGISIALGVEPSPDTVPP